MELEEQTDRVRDWIRKWKEEGETERPKRPAVHQSNRARSSDLLFNDLSIDREARLHRKKKNGGRRMPIPNSEGWSIDADGRVYTSEGRPASVTKHRGKQRVKFPTLVDGVWCRKQHMVAKVQMETNMIPQPHKGSVVLYLDGNFDNLRIENLRWVGEEGRTQKSNGRKITHHKSLAEQAWNVEDSKASRKKMPDGTYALFGNIVINGHPMTVLNPEYKAHSYD